MPIMWVFYKRRNSDTLNGQNDWINHSPLINIAQKAERSFIQSEGE